MKFKRRKETIKFGSTMILTILLIALYILANRENVSKETETIIMEDSTIEIPNILSGISLKTYEGISDKSTLNKVSVSENNMDIVTTSLIETISIPNEIQYKIINKKVIINKQNELENQEKQKKLEIKKKRYIEKIKKQLEEKKKKESDKKETPQYTYTVYDSPSGKFKSYMDWRKITSRTSDQYKLQQVAYTDPKTGIRMVEGRYCIAVGSYYTNEIGSYIDLIMSNGSVIECILGDQKDDKDTDSTNRYHIVDGSVVECVVSISELENLTKQMGDCSYAMDELKGSISQIKVYDKKANF